ncbi:MAG: hypothetical protein U0798_00095 [Gemmataceae bacterium]
MSESEPLSISFPFRPVKRSLMTGRVADLFGLTDSDPPHVVADQLVLDLTPGDVVLFTGPSGSGKSTLMKQVGPRHGAVDVMTVSLPDVPLVDALSGPLESRLEWLSACGLAEARLMLRTPSELSDGQRYRFRIALAFQAAALANPREPRLILLDEFAAVLDRTLAKVVAFNLRKLAAKTGVGLLAATTHDDLADDLNPDVHVHCRGDGVVDVERREVKKNGSVSSISFGSRPAPSPIGRISLGGIIDRIALVSPDGSF